MGRAAVEISLAGQDMSNAVLELESLLASDALLLPRAVRVQDLPEEAEIQRRFAQGLGAVAIAGMTERPSDVAKGDHMVSILDAIDEAAHGNTESLALNVAVAGDEALIDEGIMNDVELTRDADGNWHQAGYSLYGVLETAIKFHPGDHPALHEVTRTAAMDYDTLSVLDDAGYFDAGYILIIPRLAPTGAPARSIREYGYFKNIAVAWNIIRKVSPGEFTLRPMFTAGVAADLSEEVQDRKMTDAELDALYAERLSRRHDIAGVSGIYAKQGLPVTDKSADFQRGFLAHISEFTDPDHPEVDVAAWNDTVLGSGYFFGRPQAPDDIGYMGNSKRQMEALEGLREKQQNIVLELVARRPALLNEMTAAQCLAELVAHQAIDYVYDNRQYLRVLGPGLGAAAYNTMQFGGGSRSDVHSKAIVNMCGFNVRGKDGNDASESRSDKGTSETESESNASENGECEYRGTFCYCCPYNDNGSKRGAPMEVTICREANGIAYCKRQGCGAWLSADGRSYKGNIARKAETIRELKKTVAFTPQFQGSLN